MSDRLEEARWIYRFLVLDLLVLVAVWVVGDPDTNLKSFYARIAALKQRIEREG